METNLPKRALLDFSALKSGGGCQLAINFIYQLMANRDAKDFVILFPDQGPVYEEFKNNKEIGYYLYPSGSYLNRLLFESFRLSTICKRESINVSFTFFGAGLKRIKGVKSIVSMAYPIICYDESPYWKYIPKLAAIKKKVLNGLRIKRLKKADKVLVETEIMLERVRKKLDKPNIQFKQIFPAPSDFIETFDQRLAYPTNLANILVLSGTAPHKNLWRLPEIVYYLNKNNVNCQFTITGKIDYFQSLPDWGDWMAKYFNCIGSIHPTEISELYEEAQILLSLSDLESFSNNYMESWKSNTTLMVSDRDFSRHICKESAIYIEPHNPLDVALKIQYLIEDQDLQKILVKKGQERLSILPDQERKFQLLVNEIN